MIAVAAAACVNDAARSTLPPDTGTPRKPITPLGVYEITVTGLATGQPRATITPVSSAAGGHGPAKTLTRVGSGLVIENTNNATLIADGSRTGGGQRYFESHFRVRNSTGAALNNLALLLVSRTNTINGTFLSSLLKSDGTPADSSIAQYVAPTGSVLLASDGVTLLSPFPDVIQVYAEGEIAGLAPPSSVTSIFPVGFVVRPRDPAATTRQIPSTTNTNQFDGELTLAMRLPRQATAAQDVNAMTVELLLVDDSNTWMTESIEEGQDTAAVRRLRQRATQLNAGVVTVLAGSSTQDPDVDDYPGQRLICSVRVAGPVSSPTTYITTPAAYTRLAMYLQGEIVNPCGAYFRANTPDTPTEGTPYTVTFKAMDHYGNVKTAEVDTVALSQSSGPPATFGSPAGLVSGSASVNVTWSGSGVSTLNGMGRRLRSERRRIFVP